MSLNLDDLRYANLLRCVQSYHPLEDWSLTDWSTAAAGEMGEACGVVKKIRRLGADCDLVCDDHPDLVGDLSDEIADTAIYLDLLAARAGVDLGSAVRRKFNETSANVGSAVRL